MLADAREQLFKQATLTLTEYKLSIFNAQAVPKEAAGTSCWISHVIRINLYSCIRDVEMALKRLTKAIGGKVGRHVVPAAVTLLARPNLGVADFHSIVPDLPYSGHFVSCGRKRKSCCLQLFPALRTAVPERARTRSDTQFTECTSSSFVAVLGSGCPPAFRGSAV